MHKRGLRTGGPPTSVHFASDAHYPTPRKRRGSAYLVGSALALVLCPVLSSQEVVPAPAVDARTSDPRPGPKIILLNPAMRFEDVRSGSLIPGYVALESEYEIRLLDAARKGIGTRLHVVECKALDPAGTQACRQLQLLASRVARGNINAEAKESLSRLGTLDEYLVLVQFFHLKTGPGRSWNPSTGAITSKVASTLMQSALVSCKTGEVVWRGEQFVRKGLTSTDPEFHKALALLYRDFNIKQEANR